MNYLTGKSWVHLDELCRSALPWLKRYEVEGLLILLTVNGILLMRTETKEDTEGVTPRGGIYRKVYKLND